MYGSFLFKLINLHAFLSPLFPILCHLFDALPLYFYSSCLIFSSFNPRFPCPPAVIISCYFDFLHFLASLSSSIIHKYSNYLASLSIDFPVIRFICKKYIDMFRFSLSLFLLYFQFCLKVLDICVITIRVLPFDQFQCLTTIEYHRWLQYFCFCSLVFRFRLGRYSSSY